MVAKTLKPIACTMSPLISTYALNNNTIQSPLERRERWSWSVFLRLVYPALQYRRERQSLLDLLSEFGLISDGWLGSISPSGSWANALETECWRSPSLRLSYPVLQYLREWPTPTVIISDMNTVVKPKHPSSLPCICKIASFPQNKIIPLKGAPPPPPPMSSSEDKTGVKLIIIINKPQQTP